MAGRSTGNAWTDVTSIPAARFLLTLKLGLGSPTVVTVRRECGALIVRAETAEAPARAARMKALNCIVVMIIEVLLL